MTSKEQKAEKHNTGSAVPTKLPSVCFYPMQLQQLSLLTVNNKKNTWTRGGEERSENALCVLRRCCLDELLSAQRAQSSSHASLQLPPPGGAGERNVVMSLLLHDYWRIDLCLWATCVFPTLQRRHKHSMAKVFVFFIQLFFSTKGAFRRSLTYDDHSLQSCTYSSKLLLKN